MSRGLWWLTALVVAVVPVLIGFGLWQLERAEEKRALLAGRERQLALPPADLASQASVEGFRRVRLRGEYDPARYWLLDNRIHEGRFGYEVVAPLRLSGGDWVLVNRGWLEGDRSRRRLPEVTVPAGEVTLTGVVAAGTGEGFELAGEVVDAGWPKRVQWLPVGRAEAMFGEPLRPFMVRLQSGAGTLENTYRAVNMPPQKHRAYAAQWFGMAAVVLMLWVIGFRRFRTKTPGTKTPGKSRGTSE